LQKFNHPESSPLFATVTVGTFATAEAGFMGGEVSAVGASFDLVRQIDKAVKLSDQGFSQARHVDRKGFSNASNGVIIHPVFADSFHHPEPGLQKRIVILVLL